MVLVHSRMQLADPELLPIVRYQAKEVLLEKGVEVLLGDNTHAKLCPGNFVLHPRLPDPLSILGHKVPNLSELKLNVTSKNMEVVSDKGERIRTDLIICCTGLRVNSSAYKSSFCQCTHPHTVYYAHKQTGKIFTRCQHFMFSP